MSTVFTFFTFIVQIRHQKNTHTQKKKAFTWQVIKFSWISNKILLIKEVWYIDFVKNETKGEGKCVVKFVIHNLYEGNSMSIRMLSKGLIKM